MGTLCSSINLVESWYAIAENITRSGRLPDQEAKECRLFPLYTFTVKIILQTHRFLKLATARECTARDNSNCDENSRKINHCSESRAEPLSCPRDSLPESGTQLVWKAGRHGLPSNRVGKSAITRENRKTIREKL